MKLISGRPISSSPASKESFALAKAWIHECLSSKDHLYCAKICPQNTSASPNILPGHALPRPPTRLIDVGPSTGSQEPKLISLSDSQLLAELHYVALSHCWGQAQLLKILSHHTDFDLETLTQDQEKLAKIERKPLTTTSQTIGQRMRQIPMTTLPKTFRDAIQFTRGLGLRYIWIDSLCIIQDSEDDWKQEAARMADVYKNSYVTIAAESSKDSYMGMLNEGALEFDPIELPFNSKARDLHGTFFIRPVLDDWNTSVNGPRSVLRFRAWVLQESLLAPSTIRFSTQQIFWECRSKSLAEGNVTPIPPSKPQEKPWNWSQSKRFVGNADTEGVASVSESLSLNGLDKKDVLYLQWSSIIHDYSYRKLSFPSDIFPALEGLAREFNSRLHDKYIAGLWKRDLLRGLLWRVEDSKPGDIAREARPYRAPSWSWASIIGGIISDAGDCVHRVGDYRAEIVDVQIRPVGNMDWTLDSDTNHYSQITAGTLTLRGRWTACSRWPRFEEKYYDRSFTLIRETEEGFGNMFRYLDCELEEVYEARHKHGRTLSLLEIAAWNPWNENLKDILTVFPIVYYLILESGNSGDETVFKRVGLVALHQ
jgi:hypothetical protein